MSVFYITPALSHSLVDIIASAFIRSGCGSKWNESGFRPPLCTYRLNWARRTSWGWWDDWDDTVLQTQDSKFEPWRSEAEYATSRSRRLPTILTGCGSKLRCTGLESRPGRMFVIRVMHIQCFKRFKGLEFVVLTMVVRCKEPVKSFTVGHSPDFVLPSVAILPWLCQKRRKTIFPYSLYHIVRWNSCIPH